MFYRPVRDVKWGERTGNVVSRGIYNTEYALRVGKERNRWEHIN